ncbi:hypothetical protein MJO28_000542 [Puccinia striiformis f. sp. tritici]|uniref:Uncharacterized protein n=1 Tax=Puccinia striiformis f. sp. tritici TaxID=168172 RepID=A0ACC0F023_9BASI|nr:hypothetical protein MJO28_000542 [Puccinia striiformis f. sp. tritici]
MDPGIKKQIEDLLAVATEERALRQQAEAEAAKARAELAEAIAAANATPSEPSDDDIKVGYPNKFDGTRGDKAEVYLSQVSIYYAANPGKFRTDRKKIVFALSYLTGAASGWAQPFTEKIINNVAITSDDYWTAFRGMYFDLEKRSNAEKAIQALKQVKSVAQYAHTFAIHAYNTGWEATTLVSQFRQGLKQEVRMGIVLAQTAFTSLEDVISLAIKIDNELSGAEVGTHRPAQAVDPNAMDLSAFRGQLSEADKTRMMRAGQCFRCGTKGHLARECPNKNSKNKDAKIAELQAEIQRLTSGSKGSSSGGKADQSKNGASDILTRNEFDPRCFVSLPIAPLSKSRATTPPISPTACFLIDSGATHDVLSESFAKTTGVFENATPTERVISGFDGSKSQSSYEIELYVDTEPRPSKFIITKLKDTYDGILGMPWLQKYGHLIDWKERRFRLDQRHIATATAVSSYPTKALWTGTEPERHARIKNEGVCVLNTIALPQCKLNTHSSPSLVEAAGKRYSPLEKDTAEPNQPVAARAVVSSDPKTASLDGRMPVRHARITDEGVCAMHAITPPQCKLDLSPSPLNVEAAGKLYHPLELCESETPNDTDTQQQTRDSATTEVVSSDPKTASLDGRMPVRHARITDEGVCAMHAITPPQCKLDTSSSTLPIEAAGKLVPPLELNRTIAINTAKASWSSSAQLAAQGKSVVTPKDAAEIVPQRYHSYLNMFRKVGAQRLPPRRKYDFRVDLTPGALPQTSRIIPLSPAENQALDQLISEGLEHGTIRRTTSPWAAPVLFTGKKDGNLRPCFDYRKLNAVTVKNKYPLPLTMDLVDSLLDADRFTKLDLRNAYGNLRVAEGDEEKLAFICKAGQFAPLTMPFGPTGAPGYFQYFMQDILLGRIGKDVAVYLDNIMIYTQKGADHEQSVSDVLETLSKHHLWLKPEKCEFSQPEVEYLGLLISCNQIRMDPSKVKAVTDWPAPKNVTELQRFIGFSDFYRRFIDHFSGTTRPLHDLTKAHVPFRWTPQCDEAFEKLKTAFTSAPILKIANPYQAFTLW